MKKLLSLFLSAALCFCASSQVWVNCGDPSCIVNGNPAQQEEYQGNEGQGQNEGEGEEEGYPVTCEKDPGSGSEG